VERGMMRALKPALYNQSVEYQAVTLRSGHPNLVLATFMELLTQES
jgi:hypothetical protein